MRDEVRLPLWGGEPPTTVLTKSQSSITCDVVSDFVSDNINIYIYNTFHSKDNG